MIGKKTERHKTTCSYCGVGCGIVVSKDKKGKITVEGDKDHPVNRGMLCSKGMNLHYVVEDKSDRILYPQMKWSRNHPLQRVDWDTAMTRASAVFKSIISQYGSDAVGFYVSGQCTTEEYYLINKLTKGFLRTNNIDTNSRLCMSSAVVGYIKTLGEDAVPIAYDDIELADCFFITGANPAWCHPILYRRLEEHRANNPNVKVIAVDPRATQTCQDADLHLQILPGTDTALYHAIARVLIENGDVDLNFIHAHADGYDDFRELVLSKSIQNSALECGISVDDIRTAASYIGNAKGFITMWTMGLNQSTDGVDRNLALINLNLITGHIGKPGSGPFSLTGQPNAMGGREVGGMASLLAAHKDPKNPKHREEVAKFWGVQTLSDQPGLTATQMFDALLEGKMKAIWIVCTNPSVSMPDARLVDEALKKAHFVIVQDISNRSDTAKYADLLLPAAGWLEKEGTMTNSERRITYLPKVVDAPGEARPDSDIIIDFAKKMGFPGFDYESNAEIYAEHCRLTKGTKIDITGLSYERLKQEGTFQWPVPDKTHTGTPRLFENKEFYTPNGRAQILCGAPKGETETLSADRPLILTTGRIRDQWHTMTRTGKVNKLSKHIPKPYLEIHPDDASSRGLKDGLPAVIENGRGEVRVITKITDTIRPGVVFLPMHWGKTLNQDFSRSNNLTNSAFDPTSKQPGFKHTPVQVSKYKKAAQKIVVVGAGAAAFRFINTYRELNKEDEIHVFSKEQYPFYNRVLLPEYVNNHLEWENLLKFKYGEFEKLKTHLHTGVCVEQINRQEKNLLDSNGNTHHYDLLILATGSRAFIPKNVPDNVPGIFTIRDRENADSLKKHLDKPGASAVIVGGGLLGLEMAASLREMGVEISMVQLSSGLMRRQLDPLASNLLREAMEDMDVQVYTNEEVQDIKKTTDASLVARFKSGREIHCDAIIYAVGTKPNIELAVEAELAHGRGVTVNEHLQTIDPAIFAIGEIAEFGGVMNGITSAAEQQADIAAHFITGDLTSIYEGSVSMNILKIAGFDLCSIGLSQVPPNARGYEEILFIDTAKSYYKKCIVHQDRLVGAILMGDKSEFAEFKSLIESKTELSEKRLQLLRSGKAAEPVIGKLICSCNNVGEGNIENSIKAGACELMEVCENTGAGLGCGSCKPEVSHILNEMLEPTAV